MTKIIHLKLFAHITGIYKLYLYSLKSKFSRKYFWNNMINYKAVHCSKLKPNQSENVNFLGADPKSVICAFFKQGQCTKGNKCKFSHDLATERKGEKRSVYVDMRDDEEDTMENWDEAKLNEVIEKKHGEAESKMPNTEIVSNNLTKYIFKSFVIQSTGSIINRKRLDQVSA